METGQKTTLISNNLENIKHKELSIQVSLNGLSFCILNTESNSICLAKTVVFDKKKTPTTLLDQLKHQFNNFAILKESFSKIHVIHDNELSTLVPKSIFDEDHLAEYLKFNSRILQSDFITHDTLLEDELVNVYVPYININNYLFDAFGAFEYKHYSSILIEKILNQEKHITQTKLYAHISTNHFEILVIDSGKLKLYNTFDYHTKEDFLYYILFIAEQLNLNPETFNLVLLGHISEDDELYKIAYKYVRHITLYNTLSTITLENNFEKEIKHNFILLNSF